MQQRAALVISGHPDDDQAERIAWSIAEQYGDDSVEVVMWEVREDIPSWVNVWLADQLEAHRRDAGADASYMVIYMGSEADMEEEDGG